MIAVSRSTSAVPSKIATAALVGSLVLVACGGTASVPHAPSAGQTSQRLGAVLDAAWAGYKQVFIQPDGRVTDPTRGGITTSEGQSYAMLRAVWMGDETTFDTVWRWTASNLQLGGGAPFASLWNGKAVDTHSASDADSDIALALLFAARHFGQPALRAAALTTLAAIWNDDVVSIDAMNVLTAGNWAATQESPGPVINPSYFAPYAYRIFAVEDPNHPWSTLIDSSYTLLNECTNAVLDGTQSRGLPPNWCAISRATHQVVSFPTIVDADDYGYDAFRVMWRVALDALWNNEPRARAYLADSTFLRTYWNANKRLEPVYGHDGNVVDVVQRPDALRGRYR